jgi:GxxExxY protein
MHENELAREVVDAAFSIHTTLGPGLLESVYEAVLEYELRERGLEVRRQVPIPVVYGDVRLDEGFRADLIVEGKLLVELKSIEQLGHVHKKQVLTYLKLSGCRLGLLINFGALLINFGAPLIKDGIVRIVNGLEPTPSL